MKLRSMYFLLAAAASLAACHGSSGDGGGAGVAPPVGPAPPVQIELATLARAGMADAEDAMPRDLNTLEVLGNDNPSEFDDWFD